MRVMVKGGTVFSSPGGPPGVIQRYRSRGISRQRRNPKAAAERGVPGFNFIHFMLPRLRDDVYLFFFVSC